MERVGCIARGKGWAVLLGAALALAGCGRSSATAEDGDETPVFTRQPDLPQFTPEPISAYEQEGFTLGGDKRCTFATHPAQPPLLLATGYLRRPQAEVDVLVKYGGQVVEAHLQTPGGFDAIQREATFDTGGMVIDVARIDVEPDGSGPAAPGRALLRVTMAGQDRQIIEGFWLCTV